jgi:transposase-like protein
MREPNERRDLIRAVQQGGEAVPRAAARLGVPLATAYRWMRLATAARSPTPAPTFVELVAERTAQSALQIRVGVAQIEVRAGFDAHLLREVVEALRCDS